MTKILLFSIILFSCTPKKAINIINQAVDERGYISIVYTSGRDTFALDYLTIRELDSLKNN
jgi:hypothetical protein